jgi:hypothetical protein
MEKPEICSLTLVTSDSQPDAAFPAFTARFATDDVVDIFDRAKEVSLLVEPVGDNRSSIRLTASGKSIFSFSFETKTEKAEEFHSYVDRAACFVWIISTPSYEGRALIRIDTHEVVTKHIHERTLH